VDNVIKTAASALKYLLVFPAQAPRARAKKYPVSNEKANLPDNLPKQKNGK
jgi:hypothetical protein